MSTNGDKDDDSRTNRMNKNERTAVVIAETTTRSSRPSSPPPPSLHNMTTMVQTALAEAAGGAAAGIVADTIFYGVDSAKIRAQQQRQPQPQQQPSSSLGAAARQSSLFRGLVPTVLLGSVPVFGCFFLLYAPCRDYILYHYSTPTTTTTKTREGQQPSSLVSSLSTVAAPTPALLLPLASAVCAVPATLAGVPADVLKKRLILGNNNSNMTVRMALGEMVQQKGLFTGWQVNLVRDLPFAAVKLGLYEVMVQYYLEYYQTQRYVVEDNDGLSPTGAAICGIASGVACGVLTCPLDVVNTRIKAATSTSATFTNTNNTTKGATGSMFKVGRDIVRHEGFAVLFRGVTLRCAVMGLGSCIFWPIQHSVSRYLGVSVADTLEASDMPMEVYH